MNKIKIIVDSTSDLTKEYLEENNISVIPLGVTFGDKVYHDGIDITVKDLYSYVEKNKILPKTSAISVGEFITCFQKYIDEGYDIFYTGISSKMSSSYQNACLASENFEKGRILIFDSLNLSTGIGLQVTRAVKLVKEGKNLAEINEELLKIRPLVRSQFLIETMDYLYKGGRCSGVAYFLASALYLKPIIRVVDGGMIVYKKPIGKTIKACNALLEIFKKDLPNMDTSLVMLTSTFADSSEKYLYNELLKYLPAENIMVTHAGAVISSHCGPGTIGILYIMKK